MPVTANPAPLVRDAEALTRRLLADDSDRLAHCRYAAAIAEAAADALDVQDGDVLVAAAWLHDIGYAPSVAHTGFHPLDGALHLASEGWPDQTVLLVAHHSYAAILAPYFEVEHQLAVLDHVPGDAEDILTYADLRSGPTGMGALPQQRIAAIRAQHAGGSVVPPEVREGRYRLLLAAAERISAALNTKSSGWSGRRRPRATSLSGSRLGS
jgi:putative nucleotidyltransferase with HDIG domain